MAAVFLGRSLQEVTGYGAGLSGEGLRRKIAVIDRALKINQPDAADPLDVLAKVGGLDIAGLPDFFWAVPDIRCQCSSTASFPRWLPTVPGSFARRQGMP